MVYSVCGRRLVQDDALATHVSGGKQVTKLGGWPWMAFVDLGGEGGGGRSIVLEHIHSRIELPLVKRKVGGSETEVGMDWSSTFLERRRPPSGRFPQLTLMIILPR